MDPSTIRQTVSAVSWSKLAFGAAAFGVGAYLGSKIAELSRPDATLAPLGAIFSGLVALAILATLAVLAVVTASSGLAAACRSFR